MRIDCHLRLLSCRLVDCLSRRFLPVSDEAHRGCLEASDQLYRSELIIFEGFFFDLLVPLHRTGIKAWRALKTAFPDRCLMLQTGDMLTF